MFCTPTPEDVWRSLGLPADESQREYLEELLAQSERKITLVLASRGASIDAIKKDPLRARYLGDLLVEAVVRMERNAAVKAGLKSESEGNYSYTVASARDVAGHLWWPDDDLTLLLGTSRGRRVGTMRTKRMRRV